MHRLAKAISQDTPQLSGGRRLVAPVDLKCGSSEASPLSSSNSGSGMLHSSTSSDRLSGARNRPSRIFPDAGKVISKRTDPLLHRKNPDIPAPPSRSPTPPSLIVAASHGRRGTYNVYTNEDKQYFLKFIQWELKRDPTASCITICEKLSEKVSQS